MKQKISLLLLIMLIAGCQSTPQISVPDWHLVYAHDKAGNAVSGNKAQLLQYASEGRPIRVVWPIWDVLTHAADAGFLTLMNGELFAQVDAISRQIPHRQTRKSVALDAKEQSRWHAILATTGEIKSFQSIGGGLKSHQMPMQWYVFSP